MRLKRIEWRNVIFINFVSCKAILSNTFPSSRRLEYLARPALFQHYLHPHRHPMAHLDHRHCQPLYLSVTRHDGQPPVLFTGTQPSFRQILPSIRPDPVLLLALGRFEAHKEDKPPQKYKNMVILAATVTFQWAATYGLAVWCRRRRFCRLVGLDIAWSIGTKNEQSALFSVINV
jgi:hypothetical protein